MNLDKAGDFPKWVTDEIKKGTTDPLVRAYESLPEPHRTTAKRKLETMLNEMSVEMNNDAKNEWKVKRAKIPPIIKVSYNHKYDDHWVFHSIEDAANEVYKWCEQAKKTHPTLTCRSTKDDVEIPFPISKNVIQLAISHKISLYFEAEHEDRENLMYLLNMEFYKQEIESMERLTMYESNK